MIRNGVSPGHGQYIFEGESHLVVQLCSTTFVSYYLMHNRLALASDLASPFISAVYAPSSTSIPLTDSHSNSERSADRPRKEYGRSASLGNSYDFVHDHDLASLPLFFSRQSSLHQHPIIPSESCVSSTAFKGRQIAMACCHTLPCQQELATFPARALQREESMQRSLSKVLETAPSHMNAVGQERQGHKQGGRRNTTMC